MNVTDRSAIIQHLESAGLDGNSIVTKAEGDEYANRLASNTQFAADRGVFGSPTFIVGEDLFFGNDRLDFLEMRLSGLFERLSENSLS